MANFPQTSDMKDEPYKKLDAQELIGLELSTKQFIELICDAVQVIDLVIDTPNKNAAIPVTNDNNPTNTTNATLPTDWTCQYCAAKNISTNAFCEKCFIEPKKNAIKDDNKSQKYKINARPKDDISDDDNGNDNDNLVIKYIEKKVHLPSSIGAIIVSYLRIQDRQTAKVGDELWVRMDSKRFRKIVAYMQASYPWCFKGRKLKKDLDAYLEGLELWQRYRIKYDLHDFGSVLTADKLKILKDIVKALPNRAKKYAPSDLVTLYSTFNLFSSFGVSTSDIIGALMNIKQFEFNWELYGDNLENLSNNLETDQINEWRPSVDKINHFKQQLYKEILSKLYPIDQLQKNQNLKVRKIHLSTDMFRDRTKYIYDLYVGVDAVLFQRVHSD